MFPAPAQIIDLWEQGSSLSLSGFADKLLLAAFPALGAGDLQTLSLGRRNALLLALHERLTGPRLECGASCPACQEMLETDLNIPDIYRSAPAAPQLSSYAMEEGISFRLPTAADVDAAVALENDDESADVLLNLCVTAPRDLTREEKKDIERRIEMLDPLAALSFSLTCPSCGHSFNAALDFRIFLQRQIARRAMVLFHDVHLLASHYGWKEADVLALSPRRRALYRDMITA